MNEPDDEFRAHFQRQRARDESGAPNFHAMSARARTAAASRRAAWRRPWLWWLAPAAAAAVLAAFFPRPQPAPPPHDYSDRIAALLTELDAPTFAQTALPSDSLPTVFQ